MASKAIAVLALAVAGGAMTGCGDDDGGGGDDALALGETAVVEYRPTTSSGEPGDATTLAVS